MSRDDDLRFELRVGRTRAPEERPTRPATETSPTPKKEEPAVKGEMADARQRRLERLAAISEEIERRDRGKENPNRQREAPGGGHSRSH